MEDVYSNYLAEKRGFYADMLSAQGQTLKANSVDVKPFSSVGQFSATANTATAKQVFFDIGNTQEQLLVQPKTRVYYHGILFTQVYISASGGQNDSQFLLNLLTNGANAYFPVRYRSGASCNAADLQWNSGNQVDPAKGATFNSFAKILFSFLQLDLYPGAVGSLTVVSKHSFTGFKIEY